MTQLEAVLEVKESAEPGLRRLYDRLRVVAHGVPLEQGESDEEKTAHDSTAGPKHGPTDSGSASSTSDGPEPTGSNGPGVSITAAELRQERRRRSSTQSTVENMLLDLEHHLCHLLTFPSPVSHI